MMYTECLPQDCLPVGNPEVGNPEGIHKSIKCLNFDQLVKCGNHQAPTCADCPQVNNCKIIFSPLDFLKISIVVAAGKGCEVVQWRLRLDWWLVFWLLRWWFLFSSFNKTIKDEYIESLGFTKISDTFNIWTADMKNANTWRSFHGLVPRIFTPIFPLILSQRFFHIFQCFSTIFSPIFPPIKGGLGSWTICQDLKGNLLVKVG